MSIFLDVWLPAYFASFPSRETKQKGQSDRASITRNVQELHKLFKRMLLSWNWQKMVLLFWLKPRRLQLSCSLGFRWWSSLVLVLCDFFQLESRWREMKKVWEVVHFQSILFWVVSYSQGLQLSKIINTYRPALEVVDFLLLFSLFPPLLLLDLCFFDQIIIMMNRLNHKLQNGIYLLEPRTRCKMFLGEAIAKSLPCICHKSDIFALDFSGHLLVETQKLFVIFLDKFTDF